MEFSLDPAQAALKARAREFARTGRRGAAPRGRDRRHEQYPWDIVKALTRRGLRRHDDPDSLWRAGALVSRCRAGHRGDGEGCTRHGAHRGRDQHGRDLDRDGLRQRRAEDASPPGSCSPATSPRSASPSPTPAADATAMTTRADRRGNAYVINGRKHWITGGGISRLHLIFARVFDERGEELGIGGFLVVPVRQKDCALSDANRPWGCAACPRARSSSRISGSRRAWCWRRSRGSSRGFADLMNAYNSQRVGAGTVAHGDRRGRARSRRRVVEIARAVRTPHRRISGPAMDARRHADTAHGLAADAACRRTFARAGARSPIPCWPRKRRSSPPRRPSASSTRRCRCSERAAIHATCRSSAWRGTCACSPSAAGLHRSCARWSPPGCSAGRITECRFCHAANTMSGLKSAISSSSRRWRSTTSLRVWGCSVARS